MKRLSRSISPPALIPPEKLRKYAMSVHSAKTSPENRQNDIVESSIAGATAINQGDDALTNKLKVFSWNCDGLTQYLCTLPTSMDTFVKKKQAKPAESGFLAKFLLRHDPDVMCLQEVHLWSNELKEITKKLHVDAPGYKFHACLPLGKSGRRRAGVLTLYKASLEATETSTVDWDHEGRVSILSLPKLRIYNVYCLNSSENAFKDPVTNEVHGTRSERKREFDALLAKALHKEVQAGNEVILLGDLNISRYKIDALGGHLRTHHPHDLNRAHFNTLFEPFRDIIREKFPSSAKYSWFSRAGDDWTGNNDKARVDLIIGSHGLKVLDANTLEDIVERGHSDHGPLYITVQYQSPVT